MAPRCEAVIFLRQAPVSNAARAAVTALSASAASAFATCVMTSPVDGLIVGNVLPEALLTHCPLISSLFALIFTLGSITAVAVAMESSLSELSRRSQSQRTLCPLPLEIIDFVRRRLAAEEARSR